MAVYYVTRTPKINGDHEVHMLGCLFMPELNRLFLGSFANCTDAVNEARKNYSQVNGCFHCSKECYRE